MVKPDAIINIHGNEFVKYEGVLSEAHEKGLRRITTNIVQLGNKDNEYVYVLESYVTMEDGREFHAYGTASPKNATGNKGAYPVEIAETRAKARALRDAVNIAMVTVEELDESGEMPGDQGANGRRQAAPATQPSSTSSASHPLEEEITSIPEYTVDYNTILEKAREYARARGDLLKNGQANTAPLLRDLKREFPDITTPIQEASAQQKRLVYQWIVTKLTEMEARTT